MFLVESRERLDDIRKWRTRRRRHDGGGVPASFPGFGTTVVKRSCEGRKQTRLARGDSGDFNTFLDKLKQVRTLRVVGTSTLSVASAHQLSRLSQRSLSVFVLAVSLSTDHAPESPLRLSLNSLSTVAFIRSLHANYCNQTQVFLILHLTHLLTAVS